MQALSTNIVRLGFMACLVTSLATGCGRQSAEPPPKPEPVLSPPVTSPTEADASEPAELAAEPKPAVPFDPPPLEQLDRDAKWIDRPVRDALADLAADLAKELPAATPAEALALRNDSTEANATILSSLGRLPADGEADETARINRHLAVDLNSTNPILVSSSAESDVLGLTSF